MVKVKKQPAFLNGHAMKITLVMAKVLSSHSQACYKASIILPRKAEVHYIPLGENFKTSDGLLQIL